MSSSRLAVVVPCAALVLSGCGDGLPARDPHSTPPASYAAAARNSEWAQYFQQPGQTCQIAMTGRGKNIVVRTRTTESVTSVFPSSEGLRYITAESVHTVARVGSGGAAASGSGDAAASGSGDAAKPTVKNGAHHTMYTITHTGELQTERQSHRVGNWVVTSHDEYVVPSIEALRSGQTYTQQVVMSVRSLDPALSALGQFTTDGKRAVRVQVSYQLSAVPSLGPIVTPAGTYTDVFGLRTAVSAAQVLNVDNNRLADQIAGIVDAGSVSIDWYARDVGQVESLATLRGGITGVAKVTACTAST